MNLPGILLAIHRAAGPDEAFRALVDSLAALRLDAAVWLDSNRLPVRTSPSSAEITPDLAATAFHVRQSEIFPLRSELPVDATRYPRSEALLLPLRLTESERAACVLIAPEGAFSEDTHGWEMVAEALELTCRRAVQLEDAESKRRDLQRRVEESEGLHTLGLAANRTLHPEEVLDLVARFARTLLSADYVTVSTMETGRISTAASVGLRNPEGASADYRLARAIMAAERAVLIGDDAPIRPGDYPFHQAEGLRVGLGIPLSLFGEIFGALVIGYRIPRGIEARDTRFALTLAGHAAVAISNARLHEQVRRNSRQLQEAYEELSRLSQTKERFFASINHELRNPIGAVMGYLTLVLDGTFGEIPETPRGFLEKAQRSATTLRDLVNDILDLSKIAAGKMEFDFRRTAVRDIVDGALNTVGPMAGAKGISLEVDSLDGLPELHTDANRVEQILVNLLSNAVKFTPEGEVRISADVVEETRGEGAAGVPCAWLELRVADTGPGIAEEDQPLVFEEFEQVKGTKGGTGLGLPISRRLARLLGGDLILESAPGVGSTFIIRLPCASPEQPAETDPVEGIPGQLPE